MASAAMLTRTPARLIRQLDAQLDAEEAEERQRQLLEQLQTPSALIARAMIEWPEQAQAVRQFASSAGLQLGEAWRETIAAGVEALTNGKA